MTLHRILLASSLHLVKSSTRHVTLIVTRQANPPASFGRAAVRGAAEAQVFTLPGVGVVVVSGPTESDVARAAQKNSAGAVRVVMVLKTKPRKTGDAARVKAKLERGGIRVTFAVLKSKGQVSCLDFAPGGAMQMHSNTGSALHAPPASPKAPRKRT